MNKPGPELPVMQVASPSCTTLPLSPLPCSNYCKFEDWVIPIFDAMLEEQQKQGVLWTPSKVTQGSCQGSS